MTDLTLDIVKNAVAGTAAAFRCVTEYQPAGGAGDKVFPPTYEGGKYAEEERVDPATGEIMQCVLLDSVQSQANRMELALLDAMEEGSGPALPLLKVAFTDVPKPITVTSLEAANRAAGSRKRFRIDARSDGLYQARAAAWTEALRERAEQSSEAGGYHD